MSRATATRKDAGTGPQKWGTYKFDDEIEGTSNVHHEIYGQVGQPMRLQCIGDPVVAGTLYPDNGTGGVEAATSAQVYIPTMGSNVLVDYADMLLVVQVGPGLGQVRRVTGLKATIGAIPFHTLLVTPVYNPRPDDGSICALLIDLFKYAHLGIKAEFSTNNETDYVDIHVYLYDTPQETVRGSRPFVDRRIRLTNRANQVGVTKASYSHGDRYELLTHGCFGAKVYAHTISGGSVVLWAGGF